MAHYLLQSETDDLNLELSIVHDLLKRTKYINSYESLSIEQLTADNSDKVIIPIGNIPFVEKWLQLNKGITKENPLEVPKYLRLPELLNREYNIVKAKDLPRTGKWFIKDADTLKAWAYAGDMETFELDKALQEKKNEFDFSLKINPETNCVLSEYLDILSEYRVYVVDNTIVDISYYNGNPLVFPDVKVINQANNLIRLNEKWLKSYTIDVMVTSRGTSIIEVHNFTSVGLYSTLWNDDLLYAYRQGIDYLLNDNKVLEV